MNENIKAGADIHSGGGYSEGTQEGYDTFMKNRNQSVLKSRIRELAIEAGFGDQWFEEHPTGCSLPKPLMLREYTELIVKECAAIANYYSDGHVKNQFDHKTFCYQTDVGEAILKYFGIEE